MAQSEVATGSFGPNAWLVDDMYDRFLVDPSSVSESWREFFADYRSAPVSAPQVAASATSVVTAPPATSGATPTPRVEPAAGSRRARRPQGRGLPNRGHLASHPPGAP